MAADEAGDPATVLGRAEEAYVYFYAGNLVEDLDVARQAQSWPVRRHVWGVPLAASLEAGALGVLGSGPEAREAIRRAETA